MSIEKYFKSPGLCTVEECQEAKKFLEEYKIYRDKYRGLVGYDPLGFTLESNIDKADWYIDFHTNNPGFRDEG